MHFIPLQLPMAESGIATDDGVPSNTSRFFSAARYHDCFNLPQAVGIF